MAKEITVDSVIERANGCISTDLEQELVMIGPEMDAYYVMDTVGKSVWALLEQPSTVASLCSELEESYEVSPAKCREEVLGFLEQLRAAGLIRVD